MAKHSVIEPTTDLRRSPAAHLAEAMAQASVAGTRAVALREIALASAVSLRAVPGSAGHQALAEATGVGLPTGVGEVAGSVAGTAVLWLGPDEFMAFNEAGQELTEPLDSALGQAPGQVIDLSANRAVLELRGAGATLVLRKSCPADLHPRAFAVNQAITTTVANVPILLWRTAENSWYVMPRASFTEHVVHWMIDAMAEFAADPVS
ncbi:sarcosine oxidase subunit gamma [Arthrobacter sp. MYb211]|uniref:sarcosine oxidase subunit gamma family protein n=1 Tax=unclassified Arthrobacter TaxID=235627 RepID=UPI000CFDACE5|nr:MULTISPECIES: sarcosine oxidase subunit gamma family protein [unclassified Arthrobacter]PRA10017.1 sarcosine oxidase subunit gamma [Arthrobacter sp. MYb221]PRC05209.1 sarcosine oxidase subunit gamma [Arthrobacter sp. MYb211]